MAHIAFIGTGLLGGALAEAAAKRGDTVAAWNRTASKARALTQFGIRAADTPADAVRGAERVHIVVRDDAAVEEVVAAMRPGLGKSAVIVDHTTTLPVLTAERSKRLNAEGVRYLHCPVFIGPKVAREGGGTIMVAGPKELYDSVRAGLERMATRVEYFGERPDVAAVFKLCGNAIIIGQTALAADVMAIARSTSVPADEILRVVEMFNPAVAIASRGRAMASGNFTASFELTMARKDVRLMIETAASGGQPLAALPGIAKRMDDVIAAGLGAKDMAVIGSQPAATP